MKEFIAFLIFILIVVGFTFAVIHELQSDQLNIDDRSKSRSETSMDSYLESASANVTESESCAETIEFQSTDPVSPKTD